MDPLSVQQPKAAKFWLKLAFWAVAFAVGAYLGYGIAWSLAQSTWGVLGALIAGVVTVSMLGILVLIAALAAVVSDGRGRPVARAMVVAAILLPAGVGIGWAMTPVLGIGYRAPVVLESGGTMSVTLHGIAGYANQAGALAQCRSEVDTVNVAFVEANLVGTIGADIVNASLTLLPAAANDRPAVQVSIQPAVKADGNAPMWQGSADTVEWIDRDRSGRIVFTGAVLTASDEARQPAGWPALLSGTLSWSCAEWSPPGA